MENDYSILIFGGVIMLILLMYLTTIMVSEMQCKRYAAKLFIPGNVVEVYVMEGKVRPKVYKCSKYVVSGVRDSFVLLYNVETGASFEEDMCEIIKESDRVKVYDSNGGLIEDIYNYPYPCE